MKWIPPIAMFVVLAGCTTKIEQNTGGHEKESVGPRVGHEAHEGDHRAVGVEVDRRYEGTGDGSRQGERGEASRSKTSEPAEPEKKSAEKKADVKKPDVKKSEEKTSDAKKSDEKKPRP